MSKKTYKELSPREHILLRPNMYIGATNVVKDTFWVIRNKHFQQVELEYIPAMFKIINEIIDNSVDVYIATHGKYASKIKINITPEFMVSVKDNGTGIPVEKNENGEWIPKMCFGKAMAGSNFSEDEDRTGIGMNGVGAFACNVFSKWFAVKSVDLQNRRYEALWKDNAIFDKERIGKKNQNSVGVEVRFQIDIDKFDFGHVSPEIIYNNLLLLIEQRLINIAALYNGIIFDLNGKIIRIRNPREFINYFTKDSTDSVTLEIRDRYFIAVLPSDTDDFQFHSYVNGLYLKRGGTHIQLITTEIVNRLREKLTRRYKNIKPGDIKNKLFVITFFKDFPNFKTDSQTKEEMTNSRAEIRKYLEDFDFDKFANKVYKNKNLIEEITMRYRIAQELEERKAASKATRKRRKNIAKYWKPSKEHKYLVITEGDSAVGAIIAATNREDKGFFPLKGKIINAIKQPLSKIIKNKEILELSEIIGIDLADTSKNDYQFEKIVLAADADVDGQSIIALLLAYLYRFAPDLLLQGRIAILKTPIVITYKKNKIERFIFEFDEVRATEARGGFNGVTVGYKKGFGSMYESDWNELFKRYAFEQLLQYVTIEDAERDFKTLELWMDENRDFRKEMVKQEISNFDINRI